MEARVVAETELLFNMLEAPGSPPSVTKQGWGAGWLNVESEDKRESWEEGSVSKVFAKQE